MEIVPFTPQDQKVTVKFMKNIAREMGWPDAPEESYNFEKFFHLPHSGALFLIKEQGKVVGTGGYVKLSKDNLLLKRFYIEKKMRGTGIAQELLDKLLESMKSLHASRVVLDVSKRNARAIHFYEKNGFVQYHQSPTQSWEESNHPDTHVFYYLNI